MREIEGIGEVRILGNQNAIFPPANLAELCIGCLVAARQTEGVNRIVLRGLEELREPPRQLRIHQEIHRASAIRFVSLRRAP